MSTLTIRLPDDKADKIRDMARMKGISVNKLFDEWTAQMLTEMDVERRFRVMVAQGDPQAALRILEKLTKTPCCNLLRSNEAEPTKSSYSKMLVTLSGVPVVGATQKIGSIVCRSWQAKTGSLFRVRYTVPSTHEEDGMTTRATRRTQRPRNTTVERQNRRWTRNQKLARAQRLPDDVRRTLLLKGRARPTDSVRGQLLAAVLAGAALDRGDGRWIFDGSIRDLAAGGLGDGLQHSVVYLLGCMRVFCETGLLEKLDARRGRPVVYAVRVEG